MTENVKVDQKEKSEQRKNKGIRWSYNSKKGIGFQGLSWLLIIMLSRQANTFKQN